MIFFGWQYFTNVAQSFSMAPLARIFVKQFLLAKELFWYLPNLQPLLTLQKKGMVHP